MKDFLKKYHKKEQKMMMFLAGGAFVLALWVNLVLFDGNNIANQMKASVFDTQNQTGKADIFAKKDTKNISLTSGNTMKNVEQIAVSIWYNPDILNIKNITSKFGEVTLLWEKSDGMINLILSTDTKNIASENNIFHIEIEKKEEQSTQINVFNANFTDSEKQTYKLSTSGLTF